MICSPSVFLEKSRTRVKGRKTVRFHRIERKMFAPQHLRCVDFICKQYSHRQNNMPSSDKTTCPAHDEHTSISIPLQHVSVPLLHLQKLEPFPLNNRRLRGNRLQVVTHVRGRCTAAKTHRLQRHHWPLPHAHVRMARSILSHPLRLRHLPEVLR